MATTPVFVAWRIPWTEEPGRLQSIALQRTGEDWSNLAWMHSVRNAIGDYNIEKNGTLFTVYLLRIYYVQSLRWMIKSIVKFF